MRAIQSSAKTMEEAITQGLEKLGASLGDVTIDILSEGSKGFLGLLGSKPVVVKLTLREDGEEADVLSAFSLSDATQSRPSKKNGLKEKAQAAKEKVKPQEGKEKLATVKEKAQAAKEKVKQAQKESQAPVASGEKPQRSPRAGRTERAPQAAPRQTAPVLREDGSIAPAPLCDPDTPQGKAQRFLLEVTRLMGVEVSVAANRDEEGNVRVDMHGDTLGILIGRRGETLDSLQYLTSLHVNKGQDEYIRVTLDTENYRAKREEALTRLANRMASRAVKTGRKVVMEPMNPYERRILHSALQQNEAVATHSEGDEPNRHVVITLKQGQPS